MICSSWAFSNPREWTSSQRLCMADPVLIQRRVSFLRISWSSPNRSSISLGAKCLSVWSEGFVHSSIARLHASGRGIKLPFVVLASQCFVNRSRMWRTNRTRSSPLETATMKATGYCTNSSIDASATNASIWQYQRSSSTSLGWSKPKRGSKRSLHCCCWIQSLYHDSWARRRSQRQTGGRSERRF